MSDSEMVTVAENVYRGGTIVVPEGSTLTRRQAYVYGVGDDGKVDGTLSTDDLLRRAAETSELPQRMDASPPAVQGGDPIENLSDATAADVVAFLHANPTEVDRVEGIERAREKGPRTTVTDAIERIRSGG